VRFRSADQAIRFAYRMMDRAEYAKADLTGARGRGAGMSPLELHGEAAVIFSKVRALPNVEAASVFAMYGVGGERAEAMVALGSHLMPLVASDVPNRMVLQSLLLHWATRRPSIRTLARDNSVSYRQVCKWRSAVAGAWNPIHSRAMGRLDSALFGAGGYEKE